ncbi:Uncharacterised protein [Mycobacteroides abscessus subsp. abscessus]|nr:Uncharacterised protein [Mycobacteroides abscessus subsp. abscessus]
MDHVVWYASSAFMLIPGMLFGIIIRQISTHVWSKNTQDLYSKTVNRLTTCTHIQL